jgi:small subunit ribosomal protein S16
MAVKIRLARHGKKGHAFYHIVVADSRAPRDGKFIEKLGVYNPNTNPASISVNFDAALSWLNTGAQLTETTRAILSYKGVLLRKHLNGGVQKGAFTSEEAERRFDAWMQSKEQKIAEKKIALEAAKTDGKRARILVEVKRKEAKAEVVAQKRAELLAKAEEAKAAAAAAAAPAAATPAEGEAPSAE